MCVCVCVNFNVQLAPVFIARISSHDSAVDKVLLICFRLFPRKLARDANFGDKFETSGECQQAEESSDWLGSNWPKTRVQQSQSGPAAKSGPTSVAFAKSKVPSGRFTLETK